MIVQIVARYAERSVREVDRYAAWTAALRRFREDWRGGRRAAAQELPGYLEKVPEDQRAEALQDLIADHMQLSWRDAPGQRLEAYREALAGPSADMLSPASIPADLVDDELLARHARPHGDLPAVEDYARRFPGRPDVVGVLERRFLGGGRYVKLRRIGQGAMGVVWEAFDRALSRPVAIKELAPHLRGDAQAARRLADEARLTAGLEHSGIAGVHELHEEKGGAPFCVLRLVRGRTLGERIRELHHPQANRTRAERRLLWRRLLQSLLAACDAVAYAHARGVLHRDLKPGNVLLGEHGETVVLDWGLAKRAGSEPAAPELAAPGAALVGTPEYMAPEQADGTADARSDVFGLGAILYELLTGRPPHEWPDGCRPAQWQGIVRQARFPRPRRVAPGIPRALEAVCRKALSREPADRYEGARELAGDLRRFLAGEPVAARARTFLGRLWGWLRGR